MSMEHVVKKVNNLNESKKVLEEEKRRYDKFCEKIPDATWITLGCSGGSISVPRKYVNEILKLAAKIHRKNDLDLKGIINTLQDLDDCL